MENFLSERIKNVPESFIRKILSVSTRPGVISFAGGLPNADFFPVDAIKQASQSVLEKNGKQALQYAATEGNSELRHWIAKRYQDRQDINISPENILITNGSQQALDLLGKTLLNDDDSIAIEDPGYLGAIQSFSLYQPKMHGIELTEDGLNTASLKNILEKHCPKFIYTVPNFQNPTGITYTECNRQQVSKIISKYDTLLIQDDPYGELRFSGDRKTNFIKFLPEKTILLGSFSKIVTPSFRLGWIVAPDWLIQPLTIAKQAADLHTNYFSQQVIMQYLKDNALDSHIDKIIDFYGHQKQLMIKAISNHFPPEVELIDPEGGMFIWVTLPKDLSAMELFDQAIKKQVAFVPGKPFYADKNKQLENTLRLSFVTVNSDDIEQGIKRLGECIKTQLHEVHK